MTGIDLSGLRDIHIPTEPPFWPPAIGWWLVAVGTVLVIIIGVVGYRIWWNRPRQYALRELKRLSAGTDNPVILARQMSALFKRIALTRYPRERVASLSEEDWARFLSTETNGVFSDNQAKLLAFSTYLRDNTPITDDVATLSRAGQRGIIMLFKGQKDGNQNTRSS